MKNNAISINVNGWWHVHMRVHKSYIVNIQKVSKIEGATVFMDKTRVPIGAVYKLALDKKIKH